MCFGGGSSAPVKDPEAERQQELEKEKQQAQIKENKAKQVQRTVVYNQPLASGPKEPDTVSSALTKSGMPRKRIKGAQSLITGSRGGKGFYSKFG